MDVRMYSERKLCAKMQTCALFDTFSPWMTQKFILAYRTPQSLFLSYVKDIYGMFNLWSCSGMSVTVQIGILSQFVNFSPCKRFNFDFTTPNLPKLISKLCKGYLRYVKPMSLFRSVCCLKLVIFTHQCAYNPPESDLELEIE